MVVAGVVARLTGLASREALTQGMTAVVPAHRADRIARNLVAVEAGYCWVEREVPESFASQTVLVTTTPGSPQSLTDYLWHWEATSPNKLFISDDTGAAVPRTARPQPRGSSIVRGVRSPRACRRRPRRACSPRTARRGSFAFLGAIAAGMIAVPLATRITPAELDALLDHADPRGDRRRRDPPAARWRRGEDRLVRLSEPHPPDTRDAQHQFLYGVGGAAACLTYTSGHDQPTQRRSADQRRDHACSETYVAMFHSTPDMHTIVAVPLCHNTGFVDQLGHTLVAGGSIDAHRRFRLPT